MGSEAGDLDADARGDFSSEGHGSLGSLDPAQGAQQLDDPLEGRVRGRHGLGAALLIREGLPAVDQLVDGAREREGRAEDCRNRAESFEERALVESPDFPSRSAPNSNTRS